MEKQKPSSNAIQDQLQKGVDSVCLRLSTDIKSCSGFGLTHGSFVPFYAVHLTVYLHCDIVQYLLHNGDVHTTFKRLDTEIE